MRYQVRLVKTYTHHTGKRALLKPSIVENPIWRYGQRKNSRALSRSFSEKQTSEICSPRTENLKTKKKSKEKQEKRKKLICKVTGIEPGATCALDHSTTEVKYTRGSKMSVHERNRAKRHCVYAALRVCESSINAYLRLKKRQVSVRKGLVGEGT